VFLTVTNTVDKFNVSRALFHY